MSKRDFLTLLDFSSEELLALIQRGIELKAMLNRGERHEPLKGKTLAMLFEKSSTRTRVSFQVGMAQLGGQAFFLSPQDTQLGRGEPVEDAARVLSRMVDAMMVRNHSHRVLESMAAHSRVPVINGLTDLYHPCQLLADVQTYVEHRGAIEGRTVAWIGDGNNMCHSYINAARRFGFELRIAASDAFRPNEAILAAGGDKVQVTDDPQAAAQQADLVVTDVWASMGDEAEAEQRRHAFASFQVDAKLMAQAKPDALFMHCLPAHRGEEVSAEVLDGEQSVVWDEAENRLHAQKALLEFLLI